MGTPSRDGKWFRISGYTVSNKQGKKEYEKNTYFKDKVFDKEYSLNKILYNEQFYDAYTLIQQIFESAKDEIIIIDNYIDRTVLDRLIVKRKDVNVTIYTSINSKLLGNDIKLFNKQYGNLEVKYTTKVHDRIANAFALL